MIVLPPLEPAFAKTLLNAAHRDASAMALAYGITSDQKQFWRSTGDKIRKLIDGLPGDAPLAVPLQPEASEGEPDRADYLDGLLG
jgi:hypothetical protein